MQDLATTRIERPNVERSIPFATRIRPSLKRQVDRVAAAEQRSVRVIVERALTAYVASQDPAQEAR